MKNLEELIDNLSYNLNILDSLFLKLNPKYIRIKKYVVIINKIYLEKVDEWYFNNKSENKYFNITKKKLSEEFFDNKISLNKTDKLIPLLEKLGFIIIMSENTYAIPKYNFDSIINRLNPIKHIPIKNTRMSKRETKFDMQSEESYKIVYDFVLAEIKSKQYILTSEIENHFQKNKQFTNVSRRVRIGIDRCVAKHKLISTICDKMLKESLNITMGYPKIVITKKYYNYLKEQYKL